jgi:hypothetical protein
MAERLDRMSLLTLLSGSTGLNPYEASAGYMQAGHQATKELISRGPTLWQFTATLPKLPPELQPP